MDLDFHFSLRKVLFTVVIVILIIVGNVFVAYQTVKYVGGESEYSTAIKITDQKINDLEKIVEGFFQAEQTNTENNLNNQENTKSSDSDSNNPLTISDIEQDLNSNLLYQLNINSYTPDKSGLTLSQLTNNSLASQSAQKVLTVNQSGVVELVDNNQNLAFPNAQGGNPLYFDSQIWKAADKLFLSNGEIGIGKSPGVPLDVNGKTAIEGKLTIHSDWEDNLIELFPNGDSGYLSSNGGALYINNSNNPGSGIGIYSNAGADSLGNMINVKVDNPLYAQAAFYMNYDGTSNAVEIVANTDDSSSNALSITNNNTLDSALGVIGYETSKGTIKVTHNKSGNDANASGLSIDLKGTGTAAQGVYVDSTATGGTTGDLLKLRNESVDRFVVDYNGSLEIGGNGYNTSLKKIGNTTGDEFFVGTNGAFRVQRSVTDSEAFRTQISGDTQGRWLGTADGKLKWGDGSSAQDVILERSGTAKLLLNGANFDIKSPGTNKDVLTLTASDNSRLGRFVETSGGHGWFEVDDNTGTAQVLLRADGGDHYFRSGEVGIGLTGPTHQLDVFDNAASSYVANFTNDGNDANRYGLRIQAGADDGSGTTYYLDAYDGDGDQVGYISNSTGTFGLTDISDRRTKTNIADTQINGLELINKLRVVDYNRISHPNDPIIHGFIAQEVQQIYPEMVTTAYDGLLGLQKEALIPVLTKAVQEQDQKINNNQSFINPLRQVVELKHSLFNLVTDLIIKVKTTFTQSVEFSKNVLFKDSISVGNDIAGSVKIPSGQQITIINFEKNQDATPIINITAQTNIKGNIFVDNISENSFEIHLEEKQEKDVTIGWFSIIPK
ncbi:MAG: hypothetical protein GW942_01230 [Candidatus Pacebacteria bacterium]|nr:hypothetical protein [Candidatus Paceibacterota bacterium]